MCARVADGCCTYGVDVVRGDPIGTEHCGRGSLGLLEENILVWMKTGAADEWTGGDLVASSRYSQKGLFCSPGASNGREGSTDFLPRISLRATGSTNGMFLHK